jgi:anti-anti-sigma factor
MHARRRRSNIQDEARLSRNRNTHACKVLAQAPAKVIVDLSALTMLASIGIRALVASAKAIKARGGKMVLVVDAGSTVMANIRIAGVDQLIPVFGSAEDAEVAAAA